MLGVAAVILCGILVALHFPVVMNSPLAALAFAMLTTGTIGAVAIAVGAQLAPLPLFALILVSVAAFFVDFFMVSTVDRLVFHTTLTLPFESTVIATFFFCFPGMMPSTRLHFANECTCSVVEVQSTREGFYREFAWDGNAIANIKALKGNESMETYLVGIISMHFIREIQCKMFNIKVFI